MHEVLGHLRRAIPDIPSAIVINPLIHGSSRLVTVQLQHTGCNLSLRADAEWNLD